MNTKKIVGVLGSGIVGQVLARGFKKHGYDVRLGTRDPGKLAAWAEGDGRGVSVGSVEQAATGADIVVLAVAGHAAAGALQLAGKRNLVGKVVIDTTNPIVEGRATNGVLQFFTGPNESLMERLQADFTGAYFVKAFNSVGNAFMVNPSFPGGRPTMFICGDDDVAKSHVVTILDQFGWDAEDMGSVTSARAIEPLCQLWCIPGFIRGEWAHAFKLLKMS